MYINTKALSEGRLESGSSALRIESDRIYSYSTLIGVLRGDTLFCNPRKYSMTTSKQMTFLKRFYSGRGYQICEGLPND